MKNRLFPCLLLLSLFLTGCTAKVEELKEKAEQVKGEEITVKESGENKKDPADMSLEEIEDELNNMEDLEAEEDLDALDKEL